MDKRWGMRSAATWHLTCLERSKTVQTFRNLVNCNEIKRRLIKERKKKKKYLTLLESNQRLLPVWIKNGPCAAQALGTLPVWERSKTVQTFRKFVDCIEFKGRLIKRKKKEKKNLLTWNRTSDLCQCG